MNVCLIILLVVNQITGVKLSISSIASWNPNATTIAGWANGTTGSSPSQLNQPLGISVTTNDVLYISDQNNNRVVVVPLLFPANTFSIGSVGGTSANPYDVFATNTSLYVIDSQNHRIQMMSLNGSNATTVRSLSTSSWPHYLYVDKNNNIYLSDTLSHQVVLLPWNSTNITTVAGTDSQSGSSNNLLDHPYGLFVSDVGTIYVADYNNHRIMKWLSGASSGTIAAGNGTAGASSMQLSRPTQVIVDTNEYMYISEWGNSRVTRWAPNATSGVCIAACTGSAGSSSNQLYSPCSLAFDSNGSLYVSDMSNSRIQKFQIVNKDFLPASLWYNRPKFSSCASWSTTAITFVSSGANNNIKFSGIFISTNNTIYASNYSSSGNNGLVRGWRNGSSIPYISIDAILNQPNSLFVGMNGDIYVDNGVSNGQVSKWTVYATVGLTVMTITKSCFGLFVDTKNRLYCSLPDLNQVVKVDQSNGSTIPTVVVGSASNGSTSDTLNYPRGIFVDLNFTLFVADSKNDRVQRFYFNEKNGTTVAGSTAPASFSLKNPTSVILDADGYLFIVDSSNYRIVASSSFGFRCVAGCSGQSGSTADKLTNPYNIAFDSYGNLFVTDTDNGRIQNFSITSNFCGEFSYTYDQTMFIALPYVKRVEYESIPFSAVQSRKITTATVANKIMTSTTGMLISTNNAEFNIISTITPIPTVLSTTQPIRVTTTSANNSTSAGLVRTITTMGTRTVEPAFTNVLTTTPQTAQPSTKNIATSSVPTFDLTSTGVLATTSETFQTSTNNFKLSTVSTSIPGTRQSSLASQISTTVTLRSLVLTSIGNVKDIDSSTSIRTSSSSSQYITTFQRSLTTANTTVQSSIMAKQSTSTQTTSIATISNSTAHHSSSSAFIPLTCDNSSDIGDNCNISGTICDLLQPCLNDGTCNNTNTSKNGYTCFCIPGINGTHCEFDHRPCRSQTCWNNGSCHKTSNQTFICSCPKDWEGVYCEKQQDYCESVTCQNNGVCRPVVGNFSCQCLDNSYSGRYCQIIQSRLVLLKAVSKSFAWIAICAMGSAVMFVLVMDILKYFFGVDPVQKYVKKKRPRNKQVKHTAIRYIYVNAAVSRTPQHVLPTIHEETTV